MIEFKKNKKQIKTTILGALYLKRESHRDYVYNMKENLIIYIGDQRDTSTHIFEKTGLTKNKNYNEFDGVWAYEYPTISTKKKYMTLDMFAAALLNDIKESGIKDVILVGNGAGATIAAIAAQSELVKKAVCVHPSIMGTYLVDKDALLNKTNHLSIRQRLLAAVMASKINEHYGFIKDLKDGIDISTLRKDKITVINSHGYPKKKLERMKKELLSIYDFANNDGVYYNDEIYYATNGVEYHEEIVPKSYYESEEVRNVRQACELSLTKKMK